MLTSVYTLSRPLEFTFKCNRSDIMIDPGRRIVTESVRHNIVSDLTMSLAAEVKTRGCRPRFFTSTSRPDER